MNNIRRSLPAYAVIMADVFSTVAGKAMWSSQPATTSDFIRTAYLLGNGRLGGMIYLFILFGHINTLIYT